MLVNTCGMAIMRYWDTPEGKSLQKSGANCCAGNRRGRVSRIASSIALLYLVAACEGPEAPVATESAVAETLAPESYEQACGQDSLLFVELYGGIRQTIDGKDAAL